jgi:hypothetical protein
VIGGEEPRLDVESKQWHDGHPNPNQGVSAEILHVSAVKLLEEH